MPFGRNSLTVASRSVACASKDFINFYLFRVILDRIYVVPITLSVAVMIHIGVLINSILDLHYILLILSGEAEKTYWGFLRGNQEKFKGSRGRYDMQSVHAVIIVCRTKQLTY